MASKEYYERWLDFKKEFQKILVDDKGIQELAINYVGLKPQTAAVELVARIYCKYCELYNHLCDSYDQMEQTQRRIAMRPLIDAVTCRIIELKRTLEHIECFEYTYCDNAIQQLIMIPTQVDILCPYFYPFEIREKEMQYIIDEIGKGNRIGDPVPTEEQLREMEAARLEAERIHQEEKEAELKRKIAMGEDIEEEEERVYTPAELERMRAEEEYKRNVDNIQRMERSRQCLREKTKKKNKDANLYLELSGTKTPLPRDDITNRASQIIQKVYRKFMELKRERYREYKLREKIGMVLPSWKPPSAKIELERVKEVRREFRRKYYEKWLDETMKENARVFRLREDDIMEDISSEIRAWFRSWYTMNCVFDEYPWPTEDGSVLIVRGETMFPEEYEEWRKAEEKRLKAEEGNPKTKEQIKADKMAARAEKKAAMLAEKLKEKQRKDNYRKQRLNPKNDPGVYIDIGKQIADLSHAWNLYENQWKFIDIANSTLDAIKGHIKELITENSYRDIQFQLREVVDEMMRLELNLLKIALRKDLAMQGITKPPLIPKRKKPKRVRVPKPERLTTEYMYQKLFDAGIIREYKKVTLDEFWGERNYAAAEARGIPWIPKFPPPNIGDVKEQIRIRCILTLGSSCTNAERTQLIVGPKNAGKKTLIYAVATETNAVLIDLSPELVYNKFPGKEAKKMFNYISKVSRTMQPTIIFVENADKLFYKKVPKEERLLNPTRFQKDFVKQIIRPLRKDDKIMVLGTATQPWLSKQPAMYKAFPSVILMPRTDYATISFTLLNLLMNYHGVDRNFNVHSVAQTLRGYDMNTIISCVDNLLTPERIAKLAHMPLKEIEIVNCAIQKEEAVFTDQFDVNMYLDWYYSYSPMGDEYRYYMTMLATQYEMKLKEDKKKKK